jgi:pyruvate dehydrogenase E2 component (dihydrolipoamide acetyltransferase)
MAEKLLMLALSPTMEEGVITKWVKSEGQAVTQGDVLCEVETDKATMEYESQSEGTLLKITAAEGSHVKVGNTIAVIGEQGEDIAELLKDEPQAREGEKPRKEAAVQPQPKEAAEAKEHAAEAEEETEHRPPAAEAEGEAGKLRSTPLARMLAKERGIDLAGVKGTGPEGRITRDDVEKAAQGQAPGIPPAAAAAAGLVSGELKEERIAISQKRQTIARRLSESKFSAPHYYLTLSVMADDLVQARESLNAEGQQHVSLNAFLMKFAAQALRTHPEVNSSWQSDSIVRHASCDIALAMQMPEGLVAPIVRSCQSKGIIQIDAELKALVEKARGGKLALEDYEGATFTVSNLGSFGIEEFTAIINPPGSAILAAGRIMRKPVAGDSDAVTIRQVMKMTLSCDHRVIDGAIGAQFLSDLKNMIEHPIAALL